MPKVFSKAATSSARATEQDSLGGRLLVHYCICGEFIVVLDKALSKLPRRRTEGSYILRNVDSVDGQHKRRTYKLNVNTDQKAVLIRRGEEGSTAGLEKQYRLRCTRCDLPVGYETADPRAVKQKLIPRGDYTYLLAGALTSTQSAVPEDAFDLEPQVAVREAAAAAAAEEEAATAMATV